MKEEDASMEMAPLPPPPPPPPPEDDDDASSVQSNEKQSLLLQKNKKVDFREILALFHAEQPPDEADKAMWEQLWQSALVDAREEYAQQLIESKKRKALSSSATGMGGRLNAGGGGGSEFAKRLRQVRLFFSLCCVYGHLCVTYYRGLNNT